MGTARTQGRPTPASAVGGRRLCEVCSGYPRQIILTNPPSRVLYVSTGHIAPGLVSHFSLRGSPMDAPNAALREDVIQNAVNHQMQKLEASAASPAALDTIFNSELNHDLMTWPRQYLEAFLDSDESGRVPLTAEQLQDVLEAAFERDTALAVEFLEEVKAGKGPHTLPASSFQITDPEASDPHHPFDLL